jgi:hypothetical protein
MIDNCKKAFLGLFLFYWVIGKVMNYRDNVNKEFFKLERNVEIILEKVEKMEKRHELPTTR